MINPILKKGGAGVSMSRPETVERLNPLIRKHYVLNHIYEAALRRLGGGALADELQRQQKIARADIGKLNETVFSCGGVAFNGTAFEPDQFAVEGPDDGIPYVLMDVEEWFRDGVKHEFGVRPQHQIRTLAILGVVLEHSEERLSYLQSHTRTRQRPEMPEHPELWRTELEPPTTAENTGA